MTFNIFRFSLTFAHTYRYIAYDTHTYAICTDKRSSHVFVDSESNETIGIKFAHYAINISYQYCYPTAISLIRLKCNFDFHGLHKNVIVIFSR